MAESCRPQSMRGSNDAPAPYVAKPVHILGCIAAHVRSYIVSAVCSIASTYVGLYSAPSEELCGPREEVKFSVCTGDPGPRGKGSEGPHLAVYDRALHGIN